MKTKNIEIVSDEKGLYRIKERRSSGSAMYMVHANSVEEAQHLYECGSHLVRFVGSLSW